MAYFGSRPDPTPVYVYGLLLAGLIVGRKVPVLKQINLGALAFTLFHDRERFLKPKSVRGELEEKYVSLDSVTRSVDDRVLNTILGAGALIGQIVLFKKFFGVPLRFSVTNAVLDVFLEVRELDRSGKSLLDLQWKIANVSLLCDQVCGARAMQLFSRFEVPSPLGAVRFTKDTIGKYVKMHTRIALEMIPLRFATVDFVDGDVPNFGMALNARSFSVDYLLGLAKLRFGYLGFKTTLGAMAAEKLLLGKLFDYTPLYSGKGYFLAESRQVFEQAATELNLPAAVSFFRRSMGSRRHFLTAAMHGELGRHFANGLAPVYELDLENIRVLRGFLGQGFYSTKARHGLAQIVDGLRAKQNRDPFEEELARSLTGSHWIANR